jgi:hypothetical protein
MSQDPVDGLLFLNASKSLPHERSECFGYDFGRPAATTTNLNVDIEYTLQSLRPGHSGMTLGG